MKKNNGITLIALVITIIVLLILAGVSIAMITSQDGILGKAKDAKAKNEIGALMDDIAVKASELQADYYEKAYVDGNASVKAKTVTAYIVEGLTNYNTNVEVTESSTDVYKVKITSSSNSKISAEATLEKGSIGTYEWKTVE